MSMITGHMKLRDAARNVLLQIIQSFAQAKVKMAADWLAGIAAQTAATQAGRLRNSCGHGGRSRASGS